MTDIEKEIDEIKHEIIKIYKKTDKDGIVPFTSSDNWSGEAVMDFAVLIYKEVLKRWFADRKNRDKYTERRIQHLGERIYELESMNSTLKGDGWD